MNVRNTFTVDFADADITIIKRKMLNWLRSFSIFAYLDNNNYQHSPNRYELLVGAGAFAEWDTIPKDYHDWIFGHIAYDYKNRIHKKLSTELISTVPFEPSCFFCPETVVYIPHNTTQLVVETVNVNPEQIWLQIISTNDSDFEVHIPPQIDWHYNLAKDEYIAIVEQLRTHIAAGDCYEINFCREAAAANVVLDPVHVFTKLNQINSAPFAALYRKCEQWLLCTSPERFLYKDDTLLLSQPIKGTTRRGSNNILDSDLKSELQQNIKERAENVMIVDLMRNDLACCCEPGSIKVPELFGVYTFPQVHQLISTVTGCLKAGTDTNEIIRHTFPMGSMTGAPKYIVMQLIAQYEKSTRGLYSGTLGYVNPKGDFDFNVVIRSLVYNALSQSLSYHTGGAITYDSNPEQEWKEVELKAKALEQVFGA